MFVLQGKGEMVTWWLTGESNAEFRDLASLTVASWTSVSPRWSRR